MNSTEPITVLLVDDEPANIHALANLLSDDYTLRAATNGVEAMSIAKGNAPPAIVLLDWMMPKMDGLEVLRHLRTIETSQPPYVIMLTARDNDGDVIKGLEAGADDYLTKPYDPHELKARVSVAERIVRLQKKLSSQARTDMLTGILNRQGLFAAFEREMERCRRDRSLTMTVVLLDVDHFKQVNDNFGHQAGDDVLQELAQRCKSTLRSYDIIGRYGGEEFLVIFPNNDRGLPLSEKLRYMVAAAPFSTRAGDLDITISAGVVVADSAWNPDTILAAADRSLYDAKRNGRNRSCLYVRKDNRTSVRSNLPKALISRHSGDAPIGVAAHNSNPPKKMKVLLVDDEPTNLHALAHLLGQEYDIQVTTEGQQALTLCEGDNGPDIIFLDWMMPQMSGLEVLQRVRANYVTPPPYIIMLSARDSAAEMKETLDAGANDYLTKPYDATQLRTRLHIAKQVLATNFALSETAAELRQAMIEIKELRSIVPICSLCKKPRSDDAYWSQVNSYVHDHRDAEFSHGICPDCLKKHYPEIYRNQLKQ